MENLDAALIIREPWIGKILAGEKSWEMRSSRISKRGWIGLIRAGSGSVVGVTHLLDCFGPLSDAELAKSFEKHQIANYGTSEPARWRFAWVLGLTSALVRPVRYAHPNGAQSWVRLSDEVKAEVKQVLAGQRSTGVP